MGNLLAVVVHAANIHDTKSGILVAERTIAWLNNSRRLSKDYEISVVSAQAMCVIAAFRILIARF